MDLEASPLSLAGVLDHGIRSAQFHATIPVNGQINLDDEHLTRALGVADRDFINAQEFEFVTASNPTRAPIGLTVQHANGKGLRSANRTVSLDCANPEIESVHAIVHPNDTGMPFVPTKLSINKQFEGTRADLVRTATARTARWNNAELDRLAHDVETHEMDGKVRHLVETNLTETSSPISVLFHRNQENPSFMNNKYAEKNRKMVGSKLIVTDADLMSATKSLTANLTPKVHSGLTLKAQSLHGQDATGNITVAFNVTRKPLTTECYADHEDTKDACFTVAEGLQAMGEHVTPAEEIISKSVSDIHAEVFGHNLHDDA